MSPPQLPAPRPDQKYVSLSVFPGGFITLPEASFVVPSDPNVLREVPSLSFLITHPRLLSANTAQPKPFRLLFDMGLRSHESEYSPKQQRHLQKRLPYTLGPSIASQLAKGGLDARRDIDLILLSHVHYDHHGDPEHFPNSDFIVGNGSLDILRDGLKGVGSHQHFQADLLPEERTWELPAGTDDRTTFEANLRSQTKLEGQWSAMAPFPAVLDLLGDGSVYVVDSPGHLLGHINLLCRVTPDRWVYLGGDACHDTRLLRGERDISTWQDEDGVTMCIHLDMRAAKETLGRIAELQAMGKGEVSVVMAHDWEWFLRNKHNCFPKILQV